MLKDLTFSLRFKLDLEIILTLRPCPNVGNFNFAIWRQRDKEMFFCKKNCQLKKMSSILQQYFLATDVNNNVS